MRKLLMMISRAIINLVDDTKDVQTMQVDALADETHEDLEVFGLYGVGSNPPPGSEAIMAAVGGVRSNSVIIGVNNRTFRLVGLESGEVALFDDVDQVVHLKRDGIYLSSPFKVEITAPNTQINGDLNCTGTITATTNVIGGGKSLKTHKHTGVTAGGSQTGEPA